MVTDLLQADNEVPAGSADLCGSYSMLSAGQKGHLLSVDKDPERLQSTFPPFPLSYFFLISHANIVKLAIKSKKKYHCGLERHLFET